MDPAFDAWLDALLSGWARPSGSASMSSLPAAARRQSSSICRIRLPAGPAGIAPPAGSMPPSPTAPASSSASCARHPASACCR